MVYSGFLFGPTGGSWFVWFWLIMNHTHPLVLIIFEWWHNSIVVTMARFWVYTLFGFSYILVSQVLLAKFASKFGEHVYYSCDF